MNGFRAIAGPALDIERGKFCVVVESPVTQVHLALNKLEKVALRYSRKHGRPPVLIINHVNCFNNDDDGRGVLLQLQQRAETWAASGELWLCRSR